MNPGLNRATTQLHGFGFPQSDRWDVYISAWPRLPAFHENRARRVDAHFTAPLQVWSRNGNPARGPAWWPLSVTTHPHHAPVRAALSCAGRLTWHTGPCDCSEHTDSEACVSVPHRCIKEVSHGAIIFAWGLNCKRLHNKAQARPREANNLSLFELRDIAYVCC